MWTFISDEYVYDPQNRQHRLHVTFQTDIQASYAAMPRPAFFSNQLKPYFKENSMIFYSDFRRLVDKQAELENNRKINREWVEDKLYEQYQYVFYRLEKRYLRDGKIILVFSVYEKG